MGQYELSPYRQSNGIRQQPCNENTAGLRDSPNNGTAVSSSRQSSGTYEPANENYELRVSKKRSSRLSLHVHEFHLTMNTGCQSCTRVSPAFLNYGREPRPIKILRPELELESNLVQDDAEAWTHRATKLDTLRDLGIHRNVVARARQKRIYDRGRRDVRFSFED